MAYWAKVNRDNFLLVCVEAGWTLPALDHHPCHASVQRETSGQGWGVPWLWPWECKFCGCCQHSLLWVSDDGVCTFPVRPFICGPQAGIPVPAQTGSQDSFSVRTTVQCFPQKKYFICIFKAPSTTSNGLSFTLKLSCSLPSLFPVSVITLSSESLPTTCWGCHRYEMVIHLRCELAGLNKIWPCASHFLPPGLKQHGETWSLTRSSQPPTFSSSLKNYSVLHIYSPSGRKTDLQGNLHWPGDWDKHFFQRIQN